MRRTKLVLAAAAVMVAMLVAFSAPAMANDQNERNDQHNFSNISDNNHDLFDNDCCNKNNDIDFDGDELSFTSFDNGDILNDNALSLFPLFAVAENEIDIDCDGVDDDNDGGIDEGAVCVVDDVEIELA